MQKVVETVMPLLNTLFQVFFMIHRFSRKNRKKTDKFTHQIVLLFEVVCLSPFPVRCMVCTRLGNDMVGYHWKCLVQPAINLSKDGFNITQAVGDVLNNKDIEEDIKNDPGLR